MSKSKEVEATTGTERRKFGRRKTFKPATIVGPGGESISCVVVDISEVGAKIGLAAPDAAPDHFELTIVDDDFTVKCEVIHRQDTAIGVRFIASPRRLSWGSTISTAKAKEFVRRVIG